MTSSEAKKRLEQCLGLRLELQSRLQQLARLQQTDRDSPLLAGSRAEEYARQIASTVQRNRRQLAEIEAAVATLHDPLEREVLRLRYLEPSRDPQTGRKSARHTTWNEISRTMYGSSDKGACRTTIRIHGRALQHLTAIWQKSEE
ncbi:hypothetical protein H6B33_01250 [Gemmiger formicilis]|uniref:hypothetical protein n=1 Tax=Gemmiger formicilis TaxID=745368 RepID=UPI0019579925|nr:hypothetical protein [Gemmiger formicilis]MBM6914030.1 hypothetical protein [Gemmiger formicilis]